VNFSIAYGKSAQGFA